MDELKILALLLSAGILFRFALIYTGQLWAKSHAQTITFMILPIITYVITNTIANNIALSLGMIGALELVIYFALITVGIATSVRTKWAIQLIIATVLIIVIVKLFQTLSKKFGKSFYNMSFNEGVSTNTIEIIAKNKINEIEESDFLISSFNDNSENKVVYRLNFENKKELQEFRKKLKEEKIQQINIIYN